MKDLNYYKNNCEEDYLHTPISVLRYITELEKEVESKALSIADFSNSWLSPIESERNWQENHIKKIWQGYPNICPNWQTLNGLIRFSCDFLKIEVVEP